MLHTFAGEVFDLEVAERQSEHGGFVEFGHDVARVGQQCRQPLQLPRLLVAPHLGRTPTLLRPAKQETSHVQEAGPRLAKERCQRAHYFFRCCEEQK